MKNFNILIGEDNVLIAEHLQDIVTSFGYNVVGIFHNKLEIIAGIKKYHPDIALLDIKMESRYTGVEVGEYIQQNHNIPFIYITAHSEKQTLQKALKTKPAGYILKPFKEKEISIALQLAFDKFEDKTFDEDFLLVKEISSSIKIFYSDLMYIKSDGNYLEIYTKQKKYLTRDTIAKVYDKLDHEIFIQTHRSFLINKNFVIKYKNDYVFIKNIAIPVSRKYKDTVKRYFQS